MKTIFGGGEGRTELALAADEAGRASKTASGPHQMDALIVALRGPDYRKVGSRFPQRFSQQKSE
jgi:hypothetical protein